jgi:hypothetical protein
MSDTIIEILIDNSGSMGFMKGSKEFEGKYLIDGVTRMTLIKNIISEQLIPIIDYSTKIIIRTFRFNRNQGEKNKYDENDIKIIYQDIYDKKKILDVIASLQDPPIGGTPISAAINAAVDNLSKYPDSDRKIILLTDGEENGGGDYKEAAKKAEQLNGIPCKIFIIGLAQDEQSEIKSREIATGGYYNIKSKSLTLNEIQRVLTPLKAAVLQNTVQNIQTFTKKIQPQPTSQPQIQIPKIDKVEKKIFEIIQEHKQATELQLEELEKKIRNQVLNTEKILVELSSLKELYRINTLLETGIDATTLTIDSEYSENIRQRSEKFLFKFLCDKHGAAKVKWLNEKGESKSHHDFEIVNDSGIPVKIIECKGTSKTKPTFYLTAEEWNHFLTHREIYQLYRVFNVDGEMNVVCIDNLHASIINQEVVPYLKKPEILKEGRVFLTLTQSKLK